MKPHSCFINNENVILSTDLYQLTMGAAYYQYNLENNINEETDDIATFELFVRRLPKNRNYLLFTGLEQVIHYLQNAHFSERTIDYLRNNEMFKNIDSEFFDGYLPNFRFKLDMWAMKEGTFFFPNEPLIRITGPSFQAQLIETYLISAINYQTIVASKASRIKNVVKNKLLLEFGTRRAHSPQAGIYAARASFIGGFDGTSNVVSDLELGIDASGTMAHSFIQKFGEMKSFEIFHEYFGDKTIDLIDTYNIKEGTLKAAKFGNNILGVRIDSGNLAEETKKVRQLLDENGCEKVKIVLSSNLDEYLIKEILEKNAPADAFGVGTELVTSSDDPTLSAVYKLMDYNGDPKIKISEGKVTYPGRKQVYRFFDENGKFERDLLALEDEEVEERGVPLLVPIMEKGKLVYELPTLEEIREHSLKNVQTLPDSYLKLHEIEQRNLEISKNLNKLWEALKKKFS